MIKLPMLSEEETARTVPDGTILGGYVGSKSHGTYIPPEDPDSIDDIDIMSVYVDSVDYYFGLRNLGMRDRGTKTVMYKQYDSVGYELRKYVHLLLKGNPNVIGLLWLPENMYFYRNQAGHLLIDNRDLFTSRQVYKSFIGYAHGQLHRMNHYAPSKDMGNKRRKLVEKFGYDVKNAGHLIRLLRMGVEFLTEGKLNVFRHDAEELKDIKRGKWSLERVKEESDKWFGLAHEAYVRSPLPSEPDKEASEKLVIQIVRDYLGFGDGH